MVTSCLLLVSVFSGGRQDERTDRNQLVTKEHILIIQWRNFTHDVTVVLTALSGVRIFWWMESQFAF